LKIIKIIINIIIMQVAQRLLPQRCGQKEYHVEENREQRVISNRQKWCGCQRRKEMKVVHPIEGKVQQGST